MATLMGRKPMDTFKGLIRIEGELGPTLKDVLDGGGNTSPLKMSSTELSINGLIFPKSGSSPGKVLAVAVDGTSMVWIDVISGGATAKGTLKISNGTSYVDLPLGSNGKILTVDSTTESGVKWGSPPSGGSGDQLPDSINYSYKQTGEIDVITENIGSNQRISSYTYNTEGKVSVVAITYMGSTRTETYSYVNGKVTSMTSVTA